MKVEFIACSIAVQEALWLRRFMDHLGIIGEKIEPVKLYYDSQVAIAYTKDPKYQNETHRHEIQLHKRHDSAEKNNSTVHHHT